ncbi:TPA: dTDP-4-dehydrorhamnose 3,5-epimerase, partial [Enterobacter roggenkampii]
MKIIETPLKDAVIIEPKVFGDERGYFFEIYHKRRYQEFGFGLDFVQDNRSKSTKNVLRGLHFQKTKPQGKLVSVTEGSVFDVAVDLRPESPTFGQHHSVILTEDNFLQFYIPPGFAHGFCVLSDT